MRTNSVLIEWEGDYTRSAVAGLLRKVADQIEEGFSAGISPRFELRAPHIDAVYEDEEQQ